jgi:hypothetical protein
LEDGKMVSNMARVNLLMQKALKEQVFGIRVIISSLNKVMI